MSGETISTVKNRERGSGSSEKRGLKIAIIGGGPRGLYSLQSLHDELQRRDLGPADCSVTIFEPATSLGAGNVYDLNQPPCLRMNFAARHIDAWARDARPEHSSRLTLVEWLELNWPGQYAEHSFVPRALVGRYLNECYQLVENELRSLVDYLVIPERVTSLEPVSGQWVVHYGGTSSMFDEVVLTVGHEGWRESRVDDTAVPYISTFPTGSQLSRTKVPAGCNVAVRGFGLTWIDTALTLTEGRGGRFRCDENDWEYVSCGQEPRQIYPFSRTGRPMLAKPDESRFPQPESLEVIWQTGREQILKVASRGVAAQCGAELWGIVQGAAAAALAAVNGRQTSGKDVEAWFNEWTGAEMTPAKVLATMRLSCRIATGQSPPDIGWAIGAAWRNLYPALVEAVSHGGLAANAWKEFRTITGEMERIAFGPPAENLRRVVALVEAGIVNLQFLLGQVRSSADRLVLSAGDAQVPLDRCVNAVIPSPRELCGDGPLQRLLEKKTIGRLAGADGICVDHAGRPLKNGCRKADNLAIFGRATEGCILGNDTLSRKLHDHPTQWAREVVARLHSRKGLTVGG